MTTTVTAAGGEVRDSPELERLRARLVARGLGDDNPVSPGRGVAAVPADVRAAHEAYQRADYTTVACALLASPGRLDAAGDVIESALAGFPSTTGEAGEASLSLRGSVLLLAALLAARLREPAAASARLAEAAALAARLGRDGNVLWTGFGPTDVRIHAVGVAVELSQPEAAIQVAKRLDTGALPPALVSRRAQVHLDLAAAFSHTADGDPPAVRHLLEAERIAPEVIHKGRAPRYLIRSLVRHERRAATPGLRPLAERAGVLA